MRNALCWAVAVATVLAGVGCSDDERTIVRTAAPTATSAVDPTDTQVPVATDTMTPVETATPTATFNRPPTVTATMTPTDTPAGTAEGPEISYFGLATADDRVVESIGSDSAGRPIFVRELGTGLNVIVEAKPGLDLRPVGIEAFEAQGLPDFQMLLSRPLGDGSSAVCDVQIDGPNGGVPAVDPPVFSNDAATVDAINDLGCRVNDGAGNSVARGFGQACTRFESGEFSFVDPDSRAQFCLPIARAWSFPKGDTIITVRVRNVIGVVGDPKQIVVRILRELEPLPTLPVGTPAPTRTPVPPVITYIGIAAADDAIVRPIGVDEDGRPVYSRLIGSAFSLVIEAAPGSRGRPVGESAFASNGVLPDLQMLLSRDIGDGAAEVCDVDDDNQVFGGVPGVESLDFDGGPTVIAAINDLGCRVNDGTGAALGRTNQSPCTRDDFGNFSFVDRRSTIQFCLPIAKAWEFQGGDTIAAARVRGVDGGLSAVEEMLIRIAGDGREDCDPAGPGVRVFSIDDAGSSLEVAGLNVDAATGWVGTPGFLCAEPDESGVHPLRVLRDFTVGLRVADTTVLCAQFKAEGSAGILDCAGTEAHGIRHETDGLDDSTDLQSGLGDPSGEGAASLIVPVSFLSPLPPAEPADCLDMRFGEPITLGLTTGTAEAEVFNAIQGGMVAIAMTGENFDCDRWRTEDGPGTFLMPIASTVDSPAGDTASIFVLDD